MGASRIGSYEIIEKIGEGGMGVVYRAVDTKQERTVAIKTLKDNVDSSSETFIRFKKEAELLETLNHPNVLRFIEFIEQDDRLYIVTEYLEGINLREAVKSADIPVDQKVDLMLQVGRALDYVHSRGIVHRDLKPSNVIIVDNNTSAKILDFGVANLMNIQKMFTIEKNAVVGSFAYMSPEQSGILKRNVDTRSDLYSVGILFYQLITGELPYHSTDVGELIHQHIAKIPDKPEDLVQGLSPIVSKIILKLMKKDPDDRYQSAFGFAEDLQTYLGLDEEQKKSFYLELGKKDRLKNLNYRTQLIGRKKESKRLLDHLNDTILGKGFITLVLGKSGVGKSRLVSEMQRFTSSKNAFLLEVSSSERSQSQPYFPFIEIVKRIMEIVLRMPETQRQAIQESITEKLGEEGRLLAKIIPEAAPLVGEYSDDLRFSRQENEIFFEKLKDFFLTVASPKHPFVLGFDDAHFWDYGSVQLFSYLADYIEASSLYVVVSVREEDANRVEDLMQTVKERAQAGQVEILTLNPLLAEDVEDLVSEIFGDIYIGLRELGERLYESSQGNPLLVVENIKTLVEEAVLQQKEDGWSVDLDALAAFTFSSSIADKIGHRLQGIEAKTKEILGYAAVVGRDFSFSVLFAVAQQVSSDIDQEALLEHLQKAITAQLVEESMSESGGVLYTFVHEKVLDSLTTDMDEALFRKLHLLTAQKLEADYEGADKVYQLAYHYTLSGSKGKAYTYTTQAGRQAQESYSFRQAVQFLYDALAILNESGKQTDNTLQSRIKLTLEIASLNFQLGEYAKNIELLDELAAIAEEGDDQNGVAQSFYQLAKNYFFSGNQAKAMEYYHMLIPIAEELNIPELLAIPYCAIGRAQCLLANFSESIEYIQKGLDLLPAHEVLENMYSLGMLAQSYGYLGQKEKAFTALHTLQTKYGQTENEMFQLYIAFYAAAIEIMVGSPLKAIDLSQHAMQMAREQKNIALEISLQYFVGLAMSLQGRNKPAIKEISKAVRLAEENHVSLGLYNFLYNLAELYAITGKVDKAREKMAQAKVSAAIANQKLVSQWENRISAFCYLSMHPADYEAAQKEIEQAIALCDELGDDYRFIRAQSQVALAVIIALKGEVEKGEAIFREAMVVYKELDLDVHISIAERTWLRYMDPDQLQKTSSDEFDMESTHTMTATQSEFSYQRQLKYLLKLSEQLAQVHSMDELLPRIMSLAIEVSGAERGALFLCESEEPSVAEDDKGSENPGDGLVLKAKQSIDKREETEEMAYSRQVVQTTVNEGKGQLIMDAEKELDGDETVVLHSMKSIITVPMITNGAVLGAIYLDNRQVKGLFTEENFELLQAFAVEAAISIENARLYTQVQQTARMEQEMEIATDIQTSILPIVEDTDEYELAAFMRTATEVGGDYYDFDMSQEPFFGVFGDVSGHGLKSGLVMMMSEVAFNTLMTDSQVRKKPLPQLYQTINATLYDNIQGRLSQRSKLGSQYSHMYMTFRMFRFDREGNFEMFGNDHAEPVICRAADGSVEPIASTGFLMGILDEAIQGDESYSFRLKSGDILVLYSDGITEAKNISRKDSNAGMDDSAGEREMFGEERLHKIISENRQRNPKQIIERILKAVDSWMSEQEDDITLAIIKRK